MMNCRMVACGVVFVLSGCSILRIDETPCEGPGGELELKALRRESPDKLKAGYSFLVVRNGTTVNSEVNSPDATLLMKALQPGMYDIWVSGHALRGEKIEVEVKPGQRTSVAILHGNVMRRERADEIASTTGKVILYTVGAVIYGAVWCVCECVSSDHEESSDPCSWCGHKPCVCPPRKEPEVQKEPVTRTYLKH